MSSTPLSSPAVKQTMLAAAQAAHNHTLSRFRSGLAVTNKLTEGFDPVTEADRQAEAAVRAVIESHFPDHAIIGEEWDDKPSQSPYSWVIDPIDGTRAFISGVPVWGTLIGLMNNGHAFAGLMAQPFTGEMWIGIDGATDFIHAGQTVRAQTSSVTKLSQARASTTSPDLFDGLYFGSWNAIRDAVLQVRYGLDCYAYCLLASGHIDLVVEAGLKNVDIAPLVPIIEGAGGRVSTWDGGRAEKGGTCVAAATPQLHEEALDLLRRAMLD